jgi:hypothetical protein
MTVASRMIPVVACVREAGFSVPDAVHAYSVQDA